MGKKRMFRRSKGTSKLWVPAGEEGEEGVDGEEMPILKKPSLKKRPAAADYATTQEDSDHDDDCDEDEQSTDKQSTDKQSTNKQITHKQSTHKQSSHKQGTDKQSSDKQGTDKQGTDKQGTDKQEAPTTWTQNRDAATDELETKIVAFKAEVAKLKQSSPDLSLLKKHFDQKNMSALWMRMKSERKRSDLTIEEAWQHICNSKGATTTKSKTLYDFLANPGEWRGRMVRVSESIMEKKDKVHEEEELTRGQLEQQHGVAEAETLIDEGFFVHCGSLGGVQMYKRVNKKFVNTKSHQSKVELNRSQRIGEGDSDKLQLDFQAWMDQTLAASSSSSSSSVAMPKAGASGKASPDKVKKGSKAAKGKSDASPIKKKTGKFKKNLAKTIFLNAHTDPNTNIVKAGTKTLNIMNKLSTSLLKANANIKQTPLTKALKGQISQDQVAIEKYRKDMQFLLSQADPPIDQIKKVLSTVGKIIKTSDQHLKHSKSFEKGK